MIFLTAKRGQDIQTTTKDPHPIKATSQVVEIIGYGWGVHDWSEIGALGPFGRMENANWVI